MSVCASSLENARGQVLGINEIQRNTHTGKGTWNSELTQSLLLSRILLPWITQVALMFEEYSMEC